MHADLLFGCKSSLAIVGTIGHKIGAVQLKFDALRIDKGFETITFPVAGPAVIDIVGRGVTEKVTRLVTMFAIHPFHKEGVASADAEIPRDVVPVIFAVFPAVERMRQSEAMSYLVRLEEHTSELQSRVHLV